MNRVEPPEGYLEDWASGLANVAMRIPYQYVNWAYWYLGFDDPDFKVGGVVINEAVVKLTVASRLRLEEIRNGV